MANVVAEDAYIVKKLRSAGAISKLGRNGWDVAYEAVLATMNMEELAGFKGYFVYNQTPGKSKKGISAGWSAIGGQCSSAYVEGGFDAGGDPLGSSSGSAVGVSAGFGAISVGTDTTGSVVSGEGDAIEVNHTRLHLHKEQRFMRSGRQQDSQAGLG